MPCATPWIKSTAGPGKFLQLSNDKLVHAELALRFWHEHQNLYVWAPALFLYVELTIDYRCLEHPRVATEAQLPFHVPFLPPSERNFEEASHEHQRSVWPGHSLASCQTQIHTTSGPLNGSKTGLNSGRSSMP